MSATMTAAAGDDSLPSPLEDEAEDPSDSLRRCIVSGERLPRESLLRFVVAPGGEVVPDLAGGLPGRGLWLTPSREMVETAIRKRAFDRAARRSVKVPVDLAERLEALLLARCQQAIGLARRGGKAVAGFEKVTQALARREVGLLLAASDGAADGRRKIAALAAGLPVVEILSSAEIGQAFGRDFAVHASIGPGPLAGRLKADAGKLKGIRRGNVSVSVPEGPFPVARDK